MIQVTKIKIEDTVSSTKSRSQETQDTQSTKKQQLRIHIPQLQNNMWDSKRFLFPCRVIECGMKPQVDT